MLTISIDKSVDHPKVKVIPDCDERLAKAQKFAKDSLVHREQIEVINAANSVSGSVGVVSGPPDTGKIVLSAHLGILH